MADLKDKTDQNEVLSAFFEVMGRYTPNEVIGWALRFFFGNSYESIVIVDKDLRVQFMDRSTEMFHGLEQGGAKGRDIREFIPNSLMPTTIASGRPMIGRIWEVRGIKRLGSVYPLIKDGNIIGAFGKRLFPSFDEVARISGEYEIQKLKREVYYLKQKEGTGYSSLYTFNNILGNSERMRDTVEVARKIATLDADVLIFGESGTGKELFAHSIHSYIDSSKPFVRVNCPAIPFELAESHLFGHEKGAFTGATSGGKPGVFEAAEGGTVFLDEISSLPLSIQAKLLRVLQEREVMRVGSTKTKKIDFRSIAATNIDLRKLVKEGKFRDDLYYRVARAKIDIPPLRERRQDIPLYLYTFLGTINQSFKTNIIGFSSEALDILCQYDWPGNVRELIHTLEQMAIRTRNDHQIGVEELPGELRPHSGTPKKKKTEISKNVSVKQQMAEMEKEMIVSALAKADGNKRKAAKLLSMPRSTFYKKLGEYNIKPDPSSPL
jgi:transcriptional regulator with PAS, ATPase and Fis domain